MFRLQKYRVLAACVGINFIGGMLYIWSVIGSGLVRDFGWNTKEASLPYTVANLSFVAAMFLFGKLQDLKGPKITGMCSGVMVGAGLILSSLTKSPALIVITFGVLTGAGIGVTYASATPPPAKWFPPEKKGMVTGLTVAGIAASSVVYAPLANALIERSGISRTFLLIGIAAAILLLLLSQMLANPPSEYVAQDGSSPEKQEKKEISTSEMVRRADFYLLWIMFCFGSSAGLMVISQLTNIAKAQANWSAGYLLVILLAVFNAGGRIISGVASDKLGLKTLLFVSFGVQAVNMALFPFYRTVPVLAVGASLAGLCYGSLHSVFPATCIDLYGLKNFGSNYGLVMTAWGVGGVIGPMIAASIFDSSGNYQAAYYAAAALLTVAIAVVVLFSRITEKQQTGGI